MVDVLYPDLSGNGKGVVDLGADFYPSVGFMLRPALAQTITIPTLLFDVGPFQWIDLSLGGSVVFQIGQEGYPEWWGIDGVEDHIQINTAVNALTVTHLVPGKLYDGSGENKQVLPRPGVGKKYLFAGAVLRDILISDYQYPGDSNGTHGMRTGGGTIDGVILQRNLASLVSPAGPLQIFGSEMHIKNCTVQEFNGTQGYNDGFRLHQFTRACSIDHCSVLMTTSTLGAPDGFIIQGRQHKLSNLTYYGKDDCVTIKSATNPGDGLAGTRDIEAVNISSELGANVFSVGSEIGFGVENISGSNLLGRDTGSLVSYEIGRLTAYAGGYLIDAVASNGVMTSDKCVNGIVSYAARGGCYGKNLHTSKMVGTVRARDNNSAISAVSVYVNRESQEGEMLANTYIDNWSIKDIDVVDRLDGASFVDASTAYPLDHFIAIEEVNYVVGNSYQKNGRIENARFRGCASVGILITAPSNNRIQLNNIRVERWGTEVTSSALQLVSGTVEIHNFVAKPEVATRIFDISDGATVIGEFARIDMNQVNPGNPASFYWDAPADSLILEVFLVNPTTVAQGGADFSTYELRNMGNGLVIWTGSKNLVASTRVKLGDTFYFDDAASASYMLRGQQLRFNKTDTGTGRIINEGAQLIIHYIPYGER